MPLFIDRAREASRIYFRKNGANDLDFKHKSRFRHLIIFDTTAFKDRTFPPKNCLSIEVI